MHLVNDKMPISYDVDIHQHLDWHFATCKALPGLFVSHPDYDTVLKNIPESIALLIEQNEKRCVDVVETKDAEVKPANRKSYMATEKKKVA